MAEAGTEPPKLRERAYAAFTDRLLARDIVPGQFVSQRELVEITGLPLGAIRELVPRLEAEGLIVTVPQRGMQVAHVDLSLIRNAFQFRLMMERDAVGAFVREAPIEEIERLAEAHKRVIKEAAKRITPETIRRAQIVDWDMHDTIVDFLGNEIVSSAYRVNSIKIRLIRQAEVRLDPGRVETVMREHLAIVDLIRARDAERATAALAAHIQDARNRALGLSP
ncbi:MAG: GntR family transcriptional regulator [Tagaea sp.]|jgi:DNA-binding GntR family transcriptional regulator|nr:GntR family transcriptional regulator [Azospirillum sp.]MCA3268677.1 GntR family transcriptional regulator [Azospirillum sp.]MCZ8122745.1 GntR family transcriptional regulator [Magnetospirillum sp.]